MKGQWHLEFVTNLEQAQNWPPLCLQIKTRKSQIHWCHIFSILGTMAHYFGLLVTVTLFTSLEALKYTSIAGAIWSLSCCWKSSFNKIYNILLIFVFLRTLYQKSILIYIFQNNFKLASESSCFMYKFLYINRALYLKFFLWQFIFQEHLGLGLPGSVMSNQAGIQM